MKGKRHMIDEYSRVRKIDNKRLTRENEIINNLSLFFLKLIRNNPNAKIESKILSFPNLKLIPSTQVGAEPPNPQALFQS